MKEDHSDIQLIEKFLDGKMTDSEKRTFDEKVANDKEFNSVLTDMELLVEGIRQSAAQSTKSEKIERLQFFAEIMGSDERIEKEDTHRNPKVIPLYRKTWLSAAAAILALLAISFVLWTRRADPVQLYAQNFEPYPNVFEPTVRGGEGVINKREEAYHAYENGNYARAAALFTELLQTKKEPGMLLLLGNANLMLGKYPEAEKNFNTLIVDYDDLNLQAKWFLSLCYLKTGEIDKARALLSELGGTDVSYKLKAKELLKKLD